MSNNNAMNEPVGSVVMRVAQIVFAGLMTALLIWIASTLSNVDKNSAIFQTEFNTWKKEVDRRLENLERRTP